MYFTILHWTRDWEEFDYMDEYARMCSGVPTTLTKENYAEYIRWLRIFHPEMYDIYLLSVMSE